MNRLTMRNSDGTVSQPTDTTVESVFYKLAEYEDLGKTPEEIRQILIRYRTLAFNTKMKELEQYGLRSGGWDEKTDKTAIVLPGKQEHENKIVGYMNRDLEIEWVDGHKTVFSDL